MGSFNLWDALLFLAPLACSSATQVQFFVHPHLPSRHISSRVTLSVSLLENMCTVTCAPAMVHSHEHHPRLLISASDVWAFGVTVWEIMAHGALPYEDRVPRNGNLALVADHVKAGGTLQRPAQCPEAVYVYPSSRLLGAFQLDCCTIEATLHPLHRLHPHMNNDVDRKCTCKANALIIRLHSNHNVLSHWIVLRCCFCLSFGRCLYSIDGQPQSHLLSRQDDLPSISLADTLN